MTPVSDQTLDHVTQVVALTMLEAANACGVSQSTIKRRRMAGDFPNAYQASDNTWLIPTPDLLAAGLRPNRPRSAAEVSEPATEVSDQGQVDGDLAQARAELTRLTIELADERAARKVAEAQAAAYQRNLDDLRRAAEANTLALRAIAGPEPEPARALNAMRTPEPAATGDHLDPHRRRVPETPRRKWWQRAS